MYLWIPSQTRKLKVNVSLFESLYLTFCFIVSSSAHTKKNCLLKYFNGLLKTDDFGLIYPIKIEDLGDDLICLAAADTGSINNIVFNS